MWRQSRNQISYLFNLCAKHPTTSDQQQCWPHSSLYSFIHIWYRKTSNSQIGSHHHHHHHHHHHRQPHHRQPQPITFVQSWEGSHRATIWYIQMATYLCYYSSGLGSGYRMVGIHSWSSHYRYYRIGGYITIHYKAMRSIVLIDWRSRSNLFRKAQTILTQLSSRYGMVHRPGGFGQSSPKGLLGGIARGDPSAQIDVWEFHPCLSNFGNTIGTQSQSLFLFLYLYPSSLYEANEANEWSRQISD